MKLKKVHIELFLYVLLSGTYINLVGSLALSELWVFMMVPFLKWKLIFKNYSIIRTLTYLYIALLISQGFSEFINGNSPMNWMRGIMVTVTSYLSLIYLFDKLRKDSSLIVLILIALLIKNIIYLTAPNIAGSSVDIDLQSIESMQNNFKGRIGPILNSFSIILSYFLLKRKLKKLTFIFFVLMALVFITNDSRSAGMILFLTGVFIFMGSRMFVNKVKTIVGAIVISSLFYVGYIYWINGVLNKEIGGSHSYNQAIRIENPYNPFNLLMTGRAEFVVGLEAFKDKPWFGHGAWALDHTGRYRKMLIDVQGSAKGEQRKLFFENIMKSNGLIPSHSILIGMGKTNGIIAFLLVLGIVLYVLGKGMKIYNKYADGRYVAILLTHIFTIAWSALFSPISLFRLLLPISFAIVLSLYVNHTCQNKKI